MLPKNIIQILLAIAAFFAPWGEGMQHIFPNPTYFYIISVFLLLLVNCRQFFDSKREVLEVPKYYKYLLLYMLFHTIVYCVLNPDALVFGREEKNSLNDDFVLQESASGEVIARYIYFALFSLLLSYLFRKKNNLAIFSLFYVIGFSLTIVLGGFSAEYSGLFRLSGGMADPNVMAQDSILSFFLLANSIKNSNRYFKFLFLICGSISLIALILSFSRGAIMAMIICVLILTLHKVKLYKILVLSIISLFGIIAFLHSLPSDMKNMVEVRFSLEEAKESGGSERTEIWGEYLKNWTSYVVTGTGMANCQSVLVKNNSSEKRVTHNQYLLFLVEYGIIGFVLYILFFVHSWKICLDCVGTDFQYLVMPFISMSIITFFLNIDNARSFWIIISLTNFVWYSKKLVYIKYNNYH